MVTTANTLGQLADDLVTGRVSVIDLTQPLHAGTPVIELPPEFAASPGVTIETISKYDDNGPAWYWNTIRMGEHTGTHFDAPVHWITGKDLPDNACDTLPAQRFVAPACVIDVSALLVGMALLVIAAVPLQFRGYRLIHATHRLNRALADAVVQTQDPVIVTGVWWIATAAAPVYPERQFLYYGRDPSRTLTPLLERMRVDGVERFTWIGRSPPEIVEQATDAGYVPLVPTLTRTAYDLYRMQYVSFERLLEETAPPRK